MVDHKNIMSFIDIYSKKPPLAGIEEGVFLPAICHVQLGNYKEAKYLFAKSVTAMFQSPQFWKASNQPHWLVTVCILSGRNDLYASVRQEFDSYGSLKKDNYYFYYSESLITLLVSSEKDVCGQIELLLGKPKFKDTYAMGLTLKAILENDQSSFEIGLEQLLRVHEGQAKHGSLHWTAEGLLCLPAMALAYVGLKKGMKVNLMNDYLNRGYLEYVMK